MEMELTLYRSESTLKGTFGSLEGPNKRFVTAELPWKENAPSISCIKAGRYRAVWTFSPRFSRFVYLLHDVPGRTGILIHPANFPSQLQGCIALGKCFGTIDRKPGILDSFNAVREFENSLRGEAFYLTITNGFAIL